MNNPSLYNRVWPQELAVLLSDPRVIPMESGPYPQMCPNCGGHTLMMVYEIKGGPFAQPHYRSKWLDLAPGDDPQVPSRPGWYDGELKSAPCPACQGSGVQFLRANCGLTDVEQEIRLTDFLIIGRCLGKAAALNAANALLVDGLRPKGFITFHGEYGVGKSHLLKGIVNGFWRIGMRSRYATLSNLLAQIRERFEDEHGVIAVEQAVQELVKLRVLAIDEVGDSRRVNLTGWAKEVIFRLLDERYNAREERLTVLASNVAPADMTDEWGYLASRMNGGLAVEVPGPDMREYEGLARQAWYTGKPVKAEVEG